MPTAFTKSLIPLTLRNAVRPLRFVAKDLMVSVSRVQGPTRGGQASLLLVDAEGELNPLARRFFTGPV